MRVNVENYTVTQGGDNVITVMRDNTLVYRFEFDKSCSENELKNMIKQYILTARRMFENESIALSFTRYTYRDTAVIEHAHNTHKKPDTEFYKIVLKTVNTRYNELLTALTRFVEKKPVENSLQQNVAPLLYIYHHNVNVWDKPVCLDLKYGGNVAEFVLGGEFENACKTGADFGSNALMKTINKDVYNRYYTLFCSGVISI